MRLSIWAWLIISSVTADAITEHGGWSALRQRAVRFLGSAENGPYYEQTRPNPAEACGGRCGVAGRKRLEWSRRGV